MQRNHLEFWLALAAIAGITLVYLWGIRAMGAVPAAGGLFGHSIGIAGFALMLMTETLYSLRKRTRRAPWGRMSTWLKFHIFTGLVGPYMVLLHTSWKFNGLAGLVTLLTVVIVISGFIGRYIYTAIPRTVDGAEIERSELDRQIYTLQDELLHTAAESAGGGAVAAAARIQTVQTEDLSLLRARKERLEKQVEALAATRKLLGLWHAIHIPIGLGLFTAAFIHIGAALYYATFLH